ncbi:MAG: thioredoxin [Deltaproteobacteria bacterium]|nr:thioredoxin [Deltaproteobacteria bacterium]
MQIFRCSSCGQLNRIAAAREGSPVCGACKKTLDLSGAPQEVDAASMRDAIARAPVPVLVDFWAPWCGPCRRAAPMLDALARERAGQVLVLKVNSDDHPDAAAPLGIQGIPTFVMFRGGREAARQVGLPPPDGFARWIDSQLESARVAASP